VTAAARWRGRDPLSRIPVRDGGLLTVVPPNGGKGEGDSGVGRLRRLHCRVVRAVVNFWQWMPEYRYLIAACRIIRRPSSGQPFTVGHWWYGRLNGLQLLADRRMNSEYSITYDIPISACRRHFRIRSGANDNSTCSDIVQGIKRSAAAFGPPTHRNGGSRPPGGRMDRPLEQYPLVCATLFRLRLVLRLP
jgi:hypothetical protein